MRCFTACIKDYPIPFFVLTAILTGTVFYLLDSSWGHWIWFTTLVLGGLPIVYETAKGMLQARFASDIVAMLAIITASILDEAFAGAVVVLMQSGGEAIEKFGFKKASSSLGELLKREPRVAHRKNEKIEEIPVDEVRKGDILVVRPGEMISVDGTVTQGNTRVDESAITGEPLEKEKREGSSLLSGTINITTAIEMRADKVSQESQYKKIVKLVQKAQEEKAPIQRLADKYAVLFTPLALLMATLGVLITNEFVTALAVLVVATPCPLILATPLAIICGINQSAKEGIIVKGGAAIEQIGKAKNILFDKTGTITLGLPVVQDILSFKSKSKDEVLKIAAAIELFSTHSLAKAIAKKGQDSFKTLPIPSNIKEVPGKQITGVIDGVTYTLGSGALVKEMTKKDPPNRSENTVYLIEENTCIGAITFTDELRENIPEIVNQLKELNFERVIMVTGDSVKTAQKVSAKTGIMEYKAELFPEQKAEIVAKLQPPVIMVGDGINDAPALATAAVGIAMGARGAAISTEAANIVLLIDDLSKVISAIKIGKRTLFIAKQSILIGIGLSFFLMVIL